MNDINEILEEISLTLLNKIKENKATIKNKEIKEYLQNVLMIIKILSYNKESVKYKSSITEADRQLMKYFISIAKPNSTESSP